MREHLENIKHNNVNASVRLPNELFYNLACNIKTRGHTNIQQVSFAYVYCITISFFCKYAHYVDLENNTYMQNSDIKELLGYNRKTKSIDKIIKRGGVLDELGITRTTADYPISFELIDEEINNIPIREYTYISELDKDSDLYERYRDVVMNRNYEVKEPVFLMDEIWDREYGTVYQIEKTHRILIDEFITLIFDSEIDNIDILLYGYLKSKCKGYRDNMNSLPLYRFTNDLGIDATTFYRHLDKLKAKRFVEVTHKGWQTKEIGVSNDYYFKGV